MTAPCRALLAVLFVSACTEISSPRHPDGSRLAASGAAVPAGYVITPIGMVAESLVHPIQQGDYLDGRGGRMRERSQGGNLVADLGAYDTLGGGQARVLPRKAAMSGQASFIPALGTGWITDAYWNRPAGHAITRDTAKWVVPAAPSANDGQLIYLFNGIQQSQAILQPVLQWGANGSFGGSYWSATCWYVWWANNTWQARYIPIILRLNPGDTVIGVVDSASGGMACSDSASEYASQGYGTMTVTNVPEMPQAIVTLEADALQSCADYPNAVSTPFYGMNIGTHGGTQSLNWTPEDRVIDCQQHSVVVSNSNPGGEVDLYYRNPPLTTGVSGPSVVTTKGSNTWTATPSGGTGSYTYQWWEQVVGGTRYTEGASASQSLLVSAGPNFWMIARVGDGTTYVSDSVYVTDCVGQGSGCLP